MIRRADRELIDSSGLFDAAWYLNRYPDIRNYRAGPLVHYLKFGWREGRDPGPLFRANIYISRHPEVAKAKINPLLHYLRDAASLQRDPQTDADWKFVKAIEESSMLGRPYRSRDKTFASPHAVQRFSSSANPPFSASSNAVHAQQNFSEPLNILFVNYGSFDNNSAIHITGFANGLSALGHRVAVSAAGNPNDAGDFGLPRFRCVSHAELSEDATVLSRVFSGSGNGRPSLIHCWTPRHAVRSIARKIIERYGCPYIVHFEDNEVAVAAGDNVGDSGQREFVGGAAGATIIVDALRGLLPPNVPAHLLEPGVDIKLFSPGLPEQEREQLCYALGVPADAWITVYPGNIHALNENDLFSLYAAIHALNSKGLHVHLIRTGEDHQAVVDPRFAELASSHVTNLGRVRREWLIELLKLGDFFIQPGAPNEFNKCRLPSKIPEFLAMGRPIVLPAMNVGLLMSNRKNALLMRRGDAAEITECVAELLNDRVLANKLGEAARAFAIEHFNWERNTKQLESFYRLVLQSPSVTARLV